MEPGFARRYLLGVATVMLVIGLVLVVSADYSVGAMAMLLAVAVAMLALMAGRPRDRP